MSGLTRMHVHRPRSCRILLALYLSSLALVCSFILFEVLDIDGSDFQPVSPLVEARQAESHSDDLKRAILTGPFALTAQESSLVGPRLTPVQTGRRAARTAVCFTPSLATRVLLPRAAPGDGSAA
jgi:hypothetical protein